MKKLNLCLATIFVVVASTAFAASDTWTGGGADNNWTTAGNWGGVVPVPGDFLSFGGGTFTPNNNFSADTPFGNLAFTSGASGFTVTGNEIVLTNMADLGGGSVGGGSISNTTANAEAVNLPVVLAPGKHNIASTGGGVLTLGGTVTRNIDATVLFNSTTANTINLTGSGLANDTTGILGGWATYGPADYAALDGSGNVIAYTGYSLQTANFTAAAGANVKLSQNNATTTITPQNGTVADINSLLYAPSGNNNETVTVGAGNTLRLGVAGGIFTTNTAKTLLVGSTGSEFLTAGGADNTPGVLYVGSSSAGAGTPQTVVVRLQSVIQDNGSGAVSVVSFMAQDCEFGLFGAGSKLNIYSGGTYLLGGRNTENVTNAFGTGPIYVFPGAQILCQITPFTNSLFISGFGTTEGSGNGAIRANAQTITGPITLMGTAALGSKANANSTFSGVISGPGGLILGSGNTVGAGTATFTVGSANGPNTYVGDTTIGYAPSPANNTLKMAAANIMPNGSGTGNLILNARSATALSIFDLNGFSQTINGLTNTPTSAANNFVTNSAAATTATLTIGGNNATATFGGVIADGTASGAGNVALTKIGTGSETLSGANSYTGNTTVSAGTLQVSGTLASGSAVSVGAGALAGTGTINGPVTTTSASAQINQEINYLATGNTAGTLTLGSLDVSGGGACYLDIGTSHLSGNDKIVVNGALTLGSGTVFHINALGGTANLDVADYVLVQAASISGGTVSSTPVWDGATPANAANYVIMVSGNNVVLHNNTYTGPLIISATATPSSASRIQSALLSVTVTNGTVPYTVKVDASSIGGSSTLALVRNASTAPNIYIYTNSVTPSGSTANGNYSLLVSATDNASQTANANISLTVTGASLVWNGDASGNSFWDASSVEWQGGLVYRDGDFVRFDDTAAGVNAANVNLQTTLSPGGIVVSNTTATPTASYSFNGNNAIGGSASLLKQGSGMLMMLEGSDNFSGGIVVGGGSLTVGNFYGTIAISGGLTVTNNSSVVLDQNAGTISGNVIIGAGSSVQVGADDNYGAMPSGAVAMDGTLAFNNSSPDLTVGNIISGSSTGSLVKNDPNTVTLTGASTFTGNITINGGALSNNITAANNGSTGGFGASTNSGRTITVAPGAALLGGKNNWFGNQGVQDANLPAIIVNGGTVAASNYTSIGNITLNDGALLTHNSSANGTNYDGYQFRGTVTVGGASASSITSLNGKGDHLSTNTVFNVADVTGDSAPDLIVSLPLVNLSADFSQGPASLTKTGAGTMLLTATNIYTGNTVVSAGTLALGSNGTTNATIASTNIIVSGGATLDVSSRANQTLTLAAYQTLSNNTSTATLNGNFDASAGTVSLTYVSGTPSFTIKNGTLTLASSTVFKVNNIGAPLAVNSYKIISKGTGGSVAGTVPSVTVPGVTASLQITGGELYLVVTAVTHSMPHITGIRLSGTTLTITATNGADSGNFVLLESTNVALPLTNWVPVLTNTFDNSGNLNLSTNIINPNNGQQFYILSQ